MNPAPSPMAPSHAFVWEPEGVSSLMLLNPSPEYTRADTRKPLP